MPSISVKHVGKAYKTYSSAWSRFREWLTPFGRSRHTTTWVLNDISFEVERGQALGIVGMNGAGKSTLLKMIAGTLQASTGEIQVRGNIAALLELGIGFHPNFTGRQNAIMAGQLLGYSTAQLEALMPEIEAFAEIGAYLDQPVRIYSSGMQVRLAFSVATAIRPDVLIIDEALSVGDVYFQHKSFNRIREFREQGTTLIFVTHDKGVIQAICDRAILLDQGQLILEDKPDVVMDYYNAMLANRQGHAIDQVQGVDGEKITVSGNKLAVVEKIALLDQLGQAKEVIEVGELVRLQITVVANESLPQLVLGYLIKDRLGQAVFGTNTFHLGQSAQDVKKGAVLSYDFEFYANLGVGSYSITVALHDADTHINNNYFWRDRALLFEVINTQKAHFDGVTWLHPSVQLGR
jgi:lipopolysaccharide transport system ATP-binding protein